MDMEKIMFYLMVFLVVSFALIVWTNMVVQLTKKIVAWDKFPVEAWVLIVAEVSSILAFLVVCSIMHIAILWYYWVIVVAVGIVIASGAIMGYDKFYSQLFEMIKYLIALVKEFMGLFGTSGGGK